MVLVSQGCGPRCNEDFCKDLGTCQDPCGLCLLTTFGDHQGAACPLLYKADVRRGCVAGKISPCQDILSSVLGTSMARFVQESWNAQRECEHCLNSCKSKYPSRLASVRTV